MCSYEVYDNLQKCPFLYGEFQPDDTTSPELEVDGTFKLEQCHDYTKESSFIIKIKKDSIIGSKQLKLHLGTGSTCNEAIGNIAVSTNTNTTNN